VQCRRVPRQRETPAHFPTASTARSRFRQFSAATL
jgi:hypothetical protein